MATSYSGGTAVGGGTTVTQAGTGYPVKFEAAYPTNPGKLYAIPVAGIVVRYVLMIPHIIALYVLLLVVSVVQLFAWIPVFFTGKYPSGLFNLTSGTVRWMSTVQAYMVGLTDEYPAFSLTAKEGYPIQISIPEQETYNKFWAIPVVGYFAKVIMLIPHIIAVYVLLIISQLINLVAWIPVLTSGTYPEWAYSFNTGTIRWLSRITSFFFGLTDQYPPFRLTD